MKATHHKNGGIKTLVDEAPYHPGYEDAGFKPIQSKELTDDEIVYLAKRFEGVWDGAVDYKGFARAILKKAQEK